MTRDVREIPPAPRLVRWRAVLWHRWPLAFAGLFLTVYFGLVAMMLFHAGGGKPRDDAKLDVSPHRTKGEVVEVRATKATIDDQPADVAVYEMHLPGQDPNLGQCFVEHGRFSVGDTVQVAFVADEPHIHRIEGSRISLLGDFLTPVLGLLVLPGLLCGLWWLRGVIVLRATLREGDVAVAELIEARKVRFVLPEVYAATYRFRDHQACERRGQHWVRSHSSLGERIRSGTRRFAVVHARTRPTRSRLVQADDFITEAVPPPGGIPLEV